MSFFVFVSCCLRGSIEPSGKGSQDQVSVSRVCLFVYPGEATTDPLCRIRSTAKIKSYSRWKFPTGN